MNEISSSEHIKTRLQGVAELARKAPEMVLTTLAHHIDTNFLKEAYARVRKGGAPGVDGQTAADYAVNLDRNLESLLNRFKSGTYKAPPVRRVHIPKRDGTNRTRPIGVPAFEDKVLQKAVAMILEAVYEQDFYSCSYAYRPGRNQHQALDKIWRAIMAMGDAWIVEVDIKDFFGSLNHRQLRCFLDSRIRDGVIRKAIDKWLKAGVMEEGRLEYSGDGTPQGGVVSPVISNVYLHEVMDKWFAQMVKPRMRGAAEMLRFADDVVLVFKEEGDARRVMEVLPKRFAKYGLTLHPTKTRLVEFRCPQKGERKGTVFQFLGFTHYWGRSKNGKWIVTHWNKSVYSNIGQWAEWFWKGAVHINDVSLAVLKAIDALQTADAEHLILTIDGKCEFPQQELEDWNEDSFRNRFGEHSHQLFQKFGLNPANKPRILGYAEAQKMIGYEPVYGVTELLEDLARQDHAGSKLLL